jgi:hypothetical protein
MLSGASTPNFCNGVEALPQCAACIAASCGSDPAACTRARSRQHGDAVTDGLAVHERRQLPHPSLQHAAR